MKAIRGRGIQFLPTSLRQYHQHHSILDKRVFLQRAITLSLFGFACMKSFFQEGMRAMFTRWLTATKNFRVKHSGGSNILSWSMLRVGLSWSH